MIKRKITKKIMVGGVPLGGGSRISVQSMLNVPADQVEKSVEQALALEKAGCTADMSSADICEALVAQMTQISYSGLTGKDMTWNAEGQVSKAPTAYVIKGGEYVLPEA